MQKHHIEELISSEKVHNRIKELGSQITKYYKENQTDELIVVSLLKGSFIFTADLIRTIDMPINVDFMIASSYQDGMSSNRNVKIVQDLETDISGKDVLLVEDLIDTGYTLEKVMEMLELRGPRSLNICTLLDKESCREVSVPVTWVGFEVPDIFIVGYGIDYAQRYRNLDYIAGVVLE